jgi:hypothetical protein
MSMVVSQWGAIRADHLLAIVLQISQSDQATPSATPHTLVKILPDLFNIPIASQTAKKLENSHFLVNFREILASSAICTFDVFLTAHHGIN